MARTYFDPGAKSIGGFLSNDGTIEFCNRINALLKPGFTVLDLGAGRGSWHEDTCEYRKELRRIKGKVKEYICADIDEAVLGNPTSDKNLLIRNNHVPLDDHSVDLIFCDYVLEHVVDVAGFKREIARLLKPGGYFCARTPHAMHYVSVFARLIKNPMHVRVLRFLQPRREAQDVFPTAYKLNSLRRVRNEFPDWLDYSYIHSSEPQYFFGSRALYRLFQAVHAVLPKSATGNLFIFLRNGPAKTLSADVALESPTPAPTPLRAQRTA